MAERTYTIRFEDGRFLVEVEPAVEGSEPVRRYDTHKAARGWGLGLKMVHGGRLVDLAEGGTP